MGGVEKLCRELLACVRQLSQALDGLGGGRYGELSPVLDRLERELAPLYYPAPYCLTGDLVLPLSALTPESFPDAGGKATHLAILANQLALPIPPGFVVTACAFGRFLEETGLTQVMEATLAGLSPEAVSDLEAKSRVLQEMILRAPVPDALAEKNAGSLRRPPGRGGKRGAPRHAQQRRGGGFPGLLCGPIPDQFECDPGEYPARLIKKWWPANIPPGPSSTGCATAWMTGIRPWAWPGW